MTHRVASGAPGRAPLRVVNQRIRAVEEDMDRSSVSTARCSALLSTCSQRVCYWNVQNTKTWTSVATESGGSHGNDTWSVCFPSQEEHDMFHGDSEYRYDQEDNDAWYAAQEALEQAQVDMVREAADEQDADDHIAWLSRQAA